MDWFWVSFYLYVCGILVMNGYVKMYLENIKDTLPGYLKFWVVVLWIIAVPCGVFLQLIGWRSDRST